MCRDDDAQRLLGERMNIDGLEQPLRGFEAHHRHAFLGAVYVCCLQDRRRRGGNSEEQRCVLWLRQLGLCPGSDRGLTFALAFAFAFAFAFVVVCVVGAFAFKVGVLAQLRGVSGDRINDDVVGILDPTIEASCELFVRFCNFVPCILNGWV